MRLYDFSLAPNPRRVRMFLAEKGIEVPMVQVNTREREQFAESFGAINPLNAVPVLELDDGTCIAESVAICRYFEEVQPEPPLMGTDAKDRAIVEMWNRRCELMGYAAAAEAVVNDILVKAGGEGGVISIDAAGNVAMPFNSAGMYRASIDTEGNLTVAIYDDE